MMLHKEVSYFDSAIYFIYRNTNSIEKAINTFICIQRPSKGVLDISFERPKIQIT